jgi:osmoprotectant transport system permease protein
MMATVLRATAEHVIIVAIAVGVAIVLGIPLGIWCARRARAGRAALQFVDAIQTIPSLALFGFLIPVPFIGGIGMRTAIVALILYSLLPIVRNTLIGIRGVDHLVIEAGVAMVDTRLILAGALPAAALALVADGVLTVVERKLIRQ